MKYLGLFTVFFAFAFSTMAQHHEEEVENENHHCLFKKNSISIGLAPTYSFPLNSLGVNTRVYYNVGERLCFGPEFSYLKKGEESIYDFNFIGHFIFETKIAGIYPLIGANYTVEKIHDESEEAFGIVFGGGFHRNFNWITVFAEYSHIESHLRDDFATIGFMINIK
ncbi:MAG: hypothetical protein ACI837_002674 [Crocinitomicaceae bacterium]|jgi:hypothetical protein